MNIVPMRDLKDTVKIETLCREKKGPVFITKNGYGRLVVMDIEYFSELFDKISVAQSINEGLKDLKEGKIEKAEKVLTDIKALYDFL